MSSKDSKITDKKKDYVAKLNKLLDEYPSIILCNADNVGSHHMQKIRLALRGEAVVLFGKNTLIRRTLNDRIASGRSGQALLPHVKYNVGFVFTKGDLSDVRRKIVELRVPAPARVGSFAPCDVIIKAGPTGLEPTQTAFVQAVGIASKIVRNQVEIVNDVHLLKVGDKVQASHATLLAKLNIQPFNYGLVPTIVYDNGVTYSPSALDITSADILEEFSKAVSNVAAVSVVQGLPNAASVPHLIRNAYRNLLALTYSTAVTFKRAEAFKAAAAAAPKQAPAPKKEEKKEEKKPEPKKEEKKKEPEPEPEEDVGMGGLFD